MFVWIKEILRINVNTNKEEKMINAINKQKLNVVIKLLKYDINVNYVDATDNIALMLAVWKDNFDIVNVLLAVGANVNYANLFEDTVLMWTAKRDNLEIINVLLASWCWC